MSNDNTAKPTAIRVYELLTYDPESGDFRWLVDRGKSKAGKAGAIAGSNVGNGYRRIMIDGKSYLSHRLAWLYVHGAWPAKEIDHVNGSHSDNRIVNLREATSAENHQNLALSPRNTSGHTGVHWRKKERKWRAMIQIGRVQKSLGLYDSIEDAIAARVKGKAEKHLFNPFDRKA